MNMVKFCLPATAGMIIYVSSANLSSSLPGATARKSDDALTTYDAGPMPDPCTILAVMSSTEDTTLGRYSVYLTSKKS